MGRSLRLAVVGALLAVAVGLVVFTVMAFLRSSPPTVDFTTGHQQGAPVDLTVQTVGSIGFGPHPTWVSYLTQTPGGQWVHTTLWDLPAHTRVNMTVYQYDGGSPLRNQQFGQVIGTIGGDATLNGKTLQTHQRQCGQRCRAHLRHSQLGDQCAAVRQQLRTPISVQRHRARPSSPHNIVKFSFMTPGPGQYPWQCFLPCGLGFLYGNGGPMQTVGYMDGFLKVVA